MDLHYLNTYLRPGKISDVPTWGKGWAWLAGGTWLFSDVQPDLHTLVDLDQLGWSEITVDGENLVIGATCKLVDLCNYTWPSEWIAASAFRSAIAALAASMKVINMATVGGNICLALSIGTIAPLMVCLDAKYEICNPVGITRVIPASAFQTGTRQTQLQPGEALRRILIPIANLTWQIDYQRLGMTTNDTAIAIVVSGCNPDYTRTRVVIAASVAAPLLEEIQQDSGSISSPSLLAHVFIQAFPTQNYLSDFKASANYRRAMTELLITRSLTNIITL